MKIGVLGTGAVGKVIATALVEKGWEVMMGSRTPDNEKASAWVKTAGGKASNGTFNDAAAFGELIFLALNGSHALSVVRSIDPAHTKGKIVVDLTNPLDFSSGTPKMIEGLSNTTSLGEQIQNLLPGAHVVKTMNTISYKLMADARKVNNGDHHLFLSGNNTEAKNKVRGFLSENFHWKATQLLDLGGIETARSVEEIVPFWFYVGRAIGSPVFNFKVVAEGEAS